MRRFEYLRPYRETTMRIGMLLNPYGEKSPGGLGRSIFEVAKNLIELDRGNSYTLYFKEKEAPRPSFSGEHWTYKGLGSRVLWLTGTFGMDRTLDAYIFFTPIIPFFLRPKRSIVFALDFAYWSYRGSWRDELSAKMLFFLHKRALQHADAVVAISEETKQNVMRFFHVPAERITVVPLSYIPLGEKKEPLPVPNDFFLFVGVLKERKNVAGIIKAFALFARTNETYELLIAGKRGGVYAESLVRLARELGVGKRVRFLGYVTDAQLAYLYSKARAFVFPSFIEGFGMPVLEAMHAGLPVITSKSGALAEVAGDAALLVDPARPEDIATAMSRIAGDTALRAALKEKGLLRAEQFSWQKTAREILEIVTNLTHTAQ
jgi:glycosyltransferase involved in cell wall biosynthesis